MPPTRVFCLLSDTYTSYGIKRVRREPRMSATVPGCVLQIQHGIASAHTSYMVAKGEVPLLVEVPATIVAAPAPAAELVAEAPTGLVEVGPAGAGGSGSGTGTGAITAHDSDSDTDSIPALEQVCAHGLCSDVVMQ
jgi:hypothetical protein